jgi:hypothetical protein
MKSSRVARLVTAGFVFAALLGAYSASAAAAMGQVPKRVVESQAAKVLAAQTGQPLPRVTCPGGLQGRVGASIKCTLTPKGSTAKYPVTVTVRSIHGGTAHFYVQVGQAFGAANKTEFCKDNAILDQATSVAQTPSALVPIFEANESTIIDFQATAPSKIVVDAAKLVQAARKAINTGNANAFTTKAIMKAGADVDAFCGQNPDGSPVG